MTAGTTTARATTADTTTAPGSAPPPAPDVRAPVSRRTPERPCQNCGDPTPGGYCPRCGQRKVEVRVSMRRMLLDLLDDQLSINSAVPRTVFALFFRPGHLTRQYVQGRIASYVPPFRLYLVSSVLFFLVLSLVPGPDVDDLVVSPTAAEARSEVDGSTPVATRSEEREAWIPDIQVQTGSARVDGVIRERLEMLARMEPKEAIRKVGNDYLSYVPKLMFVLLPLYALLLKGVYLGSGRYYVEHFVFSLHVHAFLFLLFTVVAVAPVPQVTLALVGWMLLYPFLALRRVYGQGVGKTAVKYLALGWSYFVALAFGAVTTLAVALYLL